MGDDFDVVERNTYVLAQQICQGNQNFELLEEEEDSFVFNDTIEGLLRSLRKKEILPCESACSPSLKKALEHTAGHRSKLKNKIKNKNQNF